MIGTRHHRRGGLLPGPRDRRFFITPLVGMLADVGITGTLAAIAAPALQYGALGAGLGALTKGSIGKDALIGAGIGGIGGALGWVGGGATTAAGQAAEAAGVDPALVDSNGNYITPPIPPDYQQPGSIGAPAGQVYDTAGNLVSTGATDPNVGSTGGGALNPLSQSAADSSGSGFLGGKTGGIRNTALALGALGAVGSMLNKPSIGTWATPGPTSTTQGATYNTPYTPGGSGRTALNPFSAGAGPQASAPGQAPNYWQYGAGPENYFGNNSTAAYGFAAGGALTAAHGGHGEFSTRSGHHYVVGDGDGQDDEVPARLSDGEFVWDATTVSRLGNGSNRRGAALLEHARRQIAHDSGSDRVVQKKIHKSPLDYVAQAAGGGR